MKNFYGFLQKKLGQVEEDLYIIVKEEKYKSFKFYFYDIFVYLALALQYLFFGFLEFLIKFFVLIFKTPKEAYEILVAPLEKLALEEERVKKQIRPFPEFVEYHKKTRMLSNRVFGILVVAVVVVSVIITLIFPVGVEVLGATYTFTQTNWSGGGTANTAAHPTNSSNWTEYSSIGSGIIAVNNGADLELASTTASVTKTSEADFSGGTLSSATTTSSGSVKLSKALHINEYTIGSLSGASAVSVTASSVTPNFNGTWTIAFSSNPDISRIFKNDKFVDSATKSWKVLSVWNEANAKKIIVVDSEGNTPTVSAPATGSGTVGRWYASISAWEAARQGDLVNTRNAIERGLPYYDGAADTTYVTIDGWTTDATHYIEIFVPYSERHRGKWDNNKYRMEVSVGSGGTDSSIYVVESYVRIEGLQLKPTSNVASHHTIQNAATLTTSSDVRISNNIFNGTNLSNTNSAYAIDIYSASTANLRIWNNIFYNYNTGGTGQDWTVYLPATGGTAYVYNNTIFNNEFGIRRSGSGMAVVVKNNIYQSNSISGADGYQDGGGFNAASDYNISDLASDAPGANSKNATTTPFVDVSSNDFHLDFRDGTGNPAMNAGADLSADANLPFNTDIDGDTRSGTWDIGADDVGATLVMTHSIGNSTRDFQTLGQWEDIRGGFLTTRQVFRATQQAAFTGWETVTGQTSGATGTYTKKEYTPKSSLKGTYSNASGASKGVFVSGNYAYVANDSMGLYIIDISNPASPSLTGSLNTDGTAEDVYVSGSYAYVSDGANGLRIINVSNPAAPTESGFYDTPGTAYEVQVVGNYAYVTDDTGGLQIINISNPTSPTLAGSYSTPNLRADDLYVVGSYAYITDTSSTSTDSGLRIINVSDPASPTESGFYDTPGAPWGLHVSGNYAYVADGPTSGLRIVNVSNPASPTLAGTYATYATDVYVSGNYAYIAGGNNGLQIINVSSSTTPTFSGTYNTLGTSYEVYVSGGYAYVADGSYELQIIKSLEYFTLDGGSGTFQVGETLVGATSGATSTIGAILTTQGTIEKGEAYNDSTFTAGVDISGSTTDITHYMWLTAEPRSRHTGVWDTNKATIVGADLSGSLISIADSYSKVDGFQVSPGNTGNDYGIVINDTPVLTGIIVSNNIIKTTFGTVAGIRTGSAVGATIYNNIIQGDVQYGIWDQESQSSGYTDYIYNNTLLGAYSTGGIFTGSTYQTAIAKNNIVASCSSNCYVGTFDGSSSNNISSDATAPGTGSLTNKSVSDLRFVSTASDFIDLHIMDGSVAKDAGADLSATFTGDADDQTRGAAFDAGADEWFSSSPVYNSSGTFTSGTIDFGNPMNFTTANFSRVLTSGGIGKAMGGNNTGALGNGTSTGPEICNSYACSKTPVIISGLNNLVAVEGSNGWGNNDYHSVGLLADGTVKAWGYNGSGQLGDGTTATSTTPVTVSGISTAVAVAAGGQFSMALLANGTVKAWGDNGSGRLGDNTTTDRLTPVTVCNTGASAGQCDANPLSNVVAIAAGEGFAMALLADGTVKTWGGNGSGNLGDGTITDRNAPVSVSGITNAIAIGAGDRFAYAVLADGTVKAWGQNNRAQLGINTTTGPNICGSVACSTTPVLVCATSTTPGVCDTYLSNVVSVAGGDSFALALLSDGTMKAWGLNCSTNGCLGDGTINDRSIPVTVCNTGASAGQCDANPLTNVSAIAAGEYFSLALISDGTVKTWGSDDYGQLGDDVTLADKTTPVSVSGISGATAIGAGLYHALIVTGGARFSAAAKTADSGWQDSDYKPLGAQIGMSPTKAVFPTGFSGNRYLRYKAYFSTADSAFSPQLDDVTVNYIYYATTSPALISSPYNSNDATNILGKIAWTATTTSGTEVRFQVRSSPDNITWSQWCGESVCDDADYFAAADNNVDLTSGHPLKNGGNDKWLQYKAIFVSTGASTPTLGDVTLTYVVNAPPVLSTPTASQRTSDGKVVVDFTGYDVDTATGTAHPNQVSLTMEYWNGSTWVSASSVTGSTGWIAVSANSGSPTSYQFIWDAKTDFGGMATTTAKVRVTADDGEGANNTGVFQSAEFSLDTKNPVATLKVDGTYDGQSGAIAYVITDDNTVQCKGSNNSDYSSDGLNANSGSWVTTTTSTTTWDFTSNEPVKIYSQCKDTYQNSVTLTSEAPVTPANIVIRDSSDVAESQFREFISWDVSTSSDFASYKVYRSTDGTNYSLLSTITDINQNFLTNGSSGAWLTQGTTYYYKVLVLDSDINNSRFSSVVSDVVDGQGGTDVTSPTISNVSVSSIRPSQATITWTTDELSDSAVYYSTNLSYGSSKSSAAMVTSHSVTLTGLSPSATYNIRLVSIDPSLNSVTNDASAPGTGNLAASFSFTTSAGPVISSVSVSSVSGSSATIVWNTNVDSDSFVEFSPNSNLSSSQTTGTTTFAGGSAPLYGHSVTLTGLTVDTKYYFKVKSTDSTPNLAQDDNGGVYYTFTTVRDVTAPVISSVSATLVDDDSAVITWVTNELADSRVQYGLSSDSLTSQTALDTTLTTSHSAGISSLIPLTQYYYRVVSKDADNNQSVSSVYNFTTTDQTYVTIATPPTYIRISPPATVEPSASTVEEQISRTEGEAITQTTQFKVDRESPTVINLQVSEVTESSVRVTWETDEPATSLVEYGETTVYGFTQGRYDFKTSHDVILQYLHEGTDYNYRIKSFDNVGNFTESANKVFKTLPAKESIEKKVARLTEVKSVEEINALTQEITDILATLSDKILPPLIVGERPDIDVSSSFAVIKWSTDRPSGSVVAYSEEKDYIPESYVSLAGDAEEQATAHSVLLANLKPGTTYHFQLRSKALVGGIGKSKDFTFTTKAEAGISDLLVSDITIDSVTITWKTTVPATTRLEYGLTSDYANSKTDDAFNISHIVRLTNLTPGTLYRYRVGGVGQDTKQFFSPNLTFVTEALPSLLDVNVESVEDREVSITWFTDVAADSTVVYTNLATGKTTTYGDKQFVKNHQVQLEGLEQGTEYKLQVVSKDEKGNEVKSSEYSFATSKDVQAPLIFNVQTQSAIFSRDKVQTIISWRTDEPATSQVTYQEGTAKDPKLERQSKLNPDLSTTHTAVFTNFKPGSIYRFRLENVDQSGNVASSKDFSILTPQREETVFDLIIQNFRDIFRWTEGLQ